MKKQSIASKGKQTPASKSASLSAKKKHKVISAASRVKMARAQRKVWKLRKQGKLGKSSAQSSTAQPGSSFIGKLFAHIMLELQKQGVE